jgi:hypothetical protein
MRPAAFCVLILAILSAACSKHAANPAPPTLTTVGPPTAADILPVFTKYKIPGSGPLIPGPYPTLMDLSNEMPKGCATPKQATYHFEFIARRWREAAGTRLSGVSNRAPVKRRCPCCAI